MALTRRGLLAGSALGAAAALAACTDEPGPTSSTGTPEAPGAGADAGVRASAAADEALLIAAYEAVLAEGDDPLLRDFRDQHAEHLEALGAAPATAPAMPTALPADVAGLARLERRAADERRRACASADDPGLARLLALIAASEAQHAVALGQR